MNYLGKLQKKKKHIKRIYCLLNNEISLINDLNKTLQNNNIENDEYIKINDILNVIKKINECLFIDKELIENEIDKKIINRYGNLSSIVVYKYDYNYIELGFTENYKTKNYKRIIIDLKNNNKPELYYLLKEEINKLQSLYKTYNILTNLYKENIRAINSSLKINISLYGISIFIPDNNSTYGKILEIKYSGYESKYYTKGKKEFIECVKGKEIYLLNSIYISNKDCPDYFKNEITKEKRKKYKIKKIK